MGLLHQLCSGPGGFCQQQGFPNQTISRILLQKMIQEVLHILFATANHRWRCLIFVQILFTIFLELSQFSSTFSVFFIFLCRLIVKPLGLILKEYKAKNCQKQILKLHIVFIISLHDI